MAFPELTAQDVRNWFIRLDYLLSNAVKQNADGSWGGGYLDMEPTACTGNTCLSNHPLIRETAHAVIGYLAAYKVTNSANYKNLALSGLNWLLTEQQSDGGFIWYCDADNSKNTTHLYETGLAGRALIEGHEIFKDIRYLDASYKAYLFETTGTTGRNPDGTYPGNANYNSFPCVHMIQLWTVEQDPAILTSAVKFAKYMINGDAVSYLTVNGHWSDAHNQIYYYHQMLTRALIMLLNAMPPEHPDYSFIQNAVTLSVNYIKTHQNTDGSMYYTPTTNSSGIDDDSDYISDALWIAENKLGLDVSNTLNGLTAYQFGRQYTGLTATGLPPDTDKCKWRVTFEPKPATCGTLMKYLTACQDCGFTAE